MLRRSFLHLIAALPFGGRLAKPKSPRPVTAGIDVGNCRVTFKLSGEEKHIIHVFRLRHRTQVLPLPLGSTR